MAILKDSGVRTTYETGAQREVLESKGRCDLLPLSVIAEMASSPEVTTDPYLWDIDKFIRTGDLKYLRKCLYRAMTCLFPDRYTACLELAIHYEDGAKKYAERNWEKGLPLHSFIDSGVRHYLKLMRGDKDEPHERAFLWNLAGAIWTCENHPELNEFPVKEGSE